MQEDDAGGGPHEPGRHVQAPALPAREERAAEQRRPRDVPEGREQRARGLGLQDAADGLVVDVVEHRLQRVARALEGREARPDDRAEDHPVARLAPAQPAPDGDQDAGLADLLDDADREEGPGGRGQQVGLEQRRPDDRERPGAQEAEHDPLGRQVALPPAREREGDHRRGDQEAADHDDRRHEDGVAGELGDDRREHPDGRPNPRTTFHRRGGNRTRCSVPRRRGGRHGGVVRSTGHRRAMLRAAARSRAPFG